MQRLYFVTLSIFFFVMSACADDAANTTPCEGDECADVTPCEGDECADVTPCEGDKCEGELPRATLGETFEWGTPGVDFPTKEEMEDAGVLFPPEGEPNHLFREPQFTAPPEAAVGDSEYAQFLAQQEYIRDRHFRRSGGGCELRFWGDFQWLKTSDFAPRFGCYVEKVRTVEELVEDSPWTFSPTADHILAAQPEWYKNSWTEDYKKNFPRIAEQEYFCQTGVLMFSELDTSHNRREGQTIWQITDEGRLIMHAPPQVNFGGPSIPKFHCIQTPYGAGWFRQEFEASDIPQDADFTGPSTRYPSRVTCSARAPWVAWANAQTHLHPIAMRAPLMTAYTVGTLEDAHSPVSECEPAPTDD